MLPSGEASTLALQQILRLQGCSLAMVHLGAASSVLKVPDTKLLHWIPCCQPDGVTARLCQLDMRQVMAVHPSPNVPTFPPVMRLLRIEGGRAANVSVPAAADDLVLYPQDGISVVLLHANQEQQHRLGLGSHPGCKATATSLSMTRHDLFNKSCQPVTRHEPNLTLAGAFPDRLGRFVGLMREHQDRSALITVVRMRDLTDQSALQVEINLHESGSRGITWTLTWAPDSSLAALWPMRRDHLQSQLAEGLPLIIFRALDGQKLHNMVFDKPVATAGLPQETQVAWSPDVQQLALWGQPAQRSCISTPQVLLVDIATGALQAWLKPPQPNLPMPASCYSLHWASSSQWLLAAAHSQSDAAVRLRAEDKLCLHAFAVDASNGAILWDFPGSGYYHQIENFMGVNGLLNGWHMSSDDDANPNSTFAQIHAASCGPALANAQSSRRQMQCTRHSHFEKPFNRQLPCLAASGDFLIGELGVSKEFDGDFAAEPDDGMAESSVIYHYLPDERVGKDVDL
ncbi:hypothetical protein WJX74_001077 [Apatococcus lobatus]|uniref:Uncharacterized protein n=1 Tax=Apatococcus lobatus TaxID=904363 RepID=A0AAW1S6P0_9CHLO